MQCPACKSARTTVYDTRTRYQDGESSRWRRRRCLACDEHFTTIELRTETIAKLTRLYEERGKLREALLLLKNILYS